MLSLHLAMIMVIATIYQVSIAMKSGRTWDWVWAVWYAFVVGFNLMAGIYQLTR